MTRTTDSLQLTARICLDLPAKLVRFHALLDELAEPGGGRSNGRQSGVSDPTLAAVLHAEAWHQQRVQMNADIIGLAHLARRLEAQIDGFVAEHTAKPDMSKFRCTGGDPLCGELQACRPDGRAQYNGLCTRCNTAKESKARADRRAREKAPVDSLSADVTSTVLDLSGSPC